MEHINGRILTDAGFKEGYVTVKGQDIIEMDFGSCSTPSEKKGLIVPSFVNMHTHIGDAFIKKKNIDLPRDINKLVAPPDGLKHQLLEKSSDDEIIEGMKEAMQLMVSRGTSSFFDFRENGVCGIDLLNNSKTGIKIRPFILSRPNNLCCDPREIQVLLEKSDGIGVSSISDWEYHDLEIISEMVKRKNKFFALHVSERIREDISKVIRLHPDFIIHMTQASKKDCEMVKKENIPIVVCLQSNLFFKSTPPLNLMKKTGNMLFLGSDNAMLHQPNVLDEVRVIRTVFPGLFSVEELLQMITFVPRKVLNLKDYMHDAAFLHSSYIVLDVETLQPLTHRITIRER